MRWDDCVTGEGTEAELLWSLAASDSGRCLFLCGCGFDPRGPVALERIGARIPLDALKVIAVDLGPGGFDPNTTILAARNAARVEAALRDVNHRRVTVPETKTAGSEGSVLARTLLREEKLLNEHCVIIDISSLPSEIYFPLIRAFLDADEHGEFAGNLLVTVCENPKIDELIQREGGERALPIGSFRSGLFAETGVPSNVVWSPVLGSVKAEELTKIHNELRRPSTRLVEICPVLPFPARNPRRADDIVLALRQFLADEIRMEPRNYLYAHEGDPFDLYRQLGNLQKRYRRTLGPLGGATKVVVSAHSSKMLSVGVLLAGVEFDLPVMHVARSGYWIDGTEHLPSVELENRLHTLWLCGEPYRTQSKETA